MAIIYSYPQPTLNGGILLVGSNTNVTGNPTINVNLDALAQYVLGFFNNNGTPNTHAMFITNDTIGDSYINQTPPDPVVYPTPIIYSNENHQMNKELIGKGNVYVQTSATKVDLRPSGSMLVLTGDIQMGATTFSLSATQTYTGDEEHFGDEVHNGAIVNKSDVQDGEPTTINANTSDMYNQFVVHGSLLDNTGSSGGATQILSSDGTYVQWVDQLPNTLEYQGTWDANLNNPPLASGVGTPGHYYIVSEDGTTNLDGFNTWEIGDWAIFSNTNVWQEIDNQNIFSGSGTTNTVTKWTGPTDLGDSAITDNGATIAMSPTVQVNINSNANLLGLTNDIGGAASVNQYYGLNYFDPTGQIEIQGELRDSTGATGTAGQVLSSTGTKAEWIDVSSAAGILTGSGTLNKVAKWTPSGVVLGDSNITDDGTNVQIGAIIGDYTVQASSGQGSWFFGDDVELKTTGGDMLFYNTDAASHLRLRHYDGVNFDNQVTVDAAGVDILGDEVAINSINSQIGLTSGADLVITTTGDTQFKKVGANKVSFFNPIEIKDAIYDQSGSTGLAGQILKNDGTGKVTWSTFTPTVVGQLFEQAVTISNAELLNIAAVPKILVPSPGINYAIVVQSVAIFKPVNIGYDFPDDLYVCEASNTGVASAKQAILRASTANQGTLLRVIMPAVSSGSYVDGQNRYGLILAGNQDLVMTLDGINPTTGTSDFTVVVNYRKINITTMEYL